MAKSFKYKDDHYLDSSGVVFEKTPLDKTLTYSSEEQIVGKWTNGEILYRKVISATTPSTGATWETVAEIPSNINVKKVQAIIAGYLPIPVYITTGYYAVFQIASGNIQMNVAGYTNNSVEFIVEYTKK